MINTLQELNEKVIAIANFVVKEACENTSSGNWIFNHREVCEKCEIKYEDYLKYQSFINEEINSRDEFLDVYINDEVIDVICGLSYCPNYEYTAGDEEIFKCRADVFEKRKIEPYNIAISPAREAELTKETIKLLYNKANNAKERKKIFKDTLKLTDEECRAYKLSQFYDNDLYVGSWRVHLVYTGDRYGLDNALIHDKDRTLIEFYDTDIDLDFDKDVQGMFTGGRYYVETILGDDGIHRHSVHGLQLDGSVPEWFVSGEEMLSVFKWLREQPLKEVDIPVNTLADKLQKANFFDKYKEQASETIKRRSIEDFRRE